MEIKGVLSSIPVPKKMGDWKGSRAVSDPFIPGKAQYRIPLKPNQSILAEIKSNRPTFSVRIVEASGTDTLFDNLPEQTALRKDQALYLNKQKRAMEVLVQIRTTEIVSGEPFTLVFTEIDTDTYLKELESPQTSEPSSDSTQVHTPK
jgi:septin family protein